MELAPAVPMVVDLERELIEAYPFLVRRLTVVVHDATEAEDLAQEAFIRALSRRHLFRGGDARAWLYTIGFRLAFNQLRRRRPVLRLDETAEPAWVQRSDPDLWAALDQLEPPHRAALLLSTLDGYTHDEIGRMLSVRTGTVSSWLSRAKARLRVLLEDQDE